MSGLARTRPSTQSLTGVPGRTLATRLKEAIEELREQKIVFQALTDQLQEGHVVLWEAEVQVWEADPGSCDDPYIVISQGTLPAVRRTNGSLPRARDD